MYNKLNKLIVSILNDDDKADIKSTWDIQELADVLDSLKTHKYAWGDPMKDPERNVSERILSLNPLLRQDLDKEAIILGDAIYNFFLKNLSNVQDPKKLARLLSQFDYIQKNDGILNKNSETIDDNSFTWWLASKAALKYSDFVAVFDKIMDGADVEKPIAPLPTLELGVYAAIASIYNGKMFQHFADAISTTIYNKWKSLSEDERKNILIKNKYISYGSDGKARNGMLTNFEKKEKWEDDKYDSIYDSDVMPKYPNILFIEGIAGGGKSTLLKLITKILFDLNPEIDSKGNKLNKAPIFVAHGTKENAEKLIKSFNAPDEWAFKAFDKTKLLEFFSDDYKDTYDGTDKEYKYYLNTEDNKSGNIVYNKVTKRYEATWKIKEFADKSDIPKVIFIDEWSHYTLPEIDFLSRVAKKYGIQIIACGDLDLITPRATLYIPKIANGVKKYEPADITIDRNLFPRVPKLGISMRTGNGLKTYNQTVVRAWKLNKKLPIELTHIEVNGLLYGDKVYNSDEEVSDAILDSVKKDIQKMVDSLNPGEKIGYFHSWGPGKEKSRIHKMIESEFRQYFDLFHEKDAQGKEARYYIIENDRSLYHMKKGSNGKEERIANNPEIYQEALYTGMTRSLLASIIIAPMSPMGNTEMGTIQVKNAADQPNLLIPDNYTGAGIRKYTKARKESLAKAWNSYVTETGNPNTDINSVRLTYIPREGQPIDIVVPPGDGVTEALAKTDAPINDDLPDNIPPEDRGNPPKGPEPSLDNEKKSDTDSDAEPPQPSTLEDNSPDNEPPTSPTVAKYAVDDIIENGNNVVKIVEVNKLNTGGYSYTINQINSGVQSSSNKTWPEDKIDNLISQDGYKLRQKTPTTTDAAVEPDTTFDDLNEKDRLEALEEILKDEDSPEEEDVEEGAKSEIKTADNKIKKIPDLNFSIFGYSFNTFYSGINYDKETGEVVVTDSDVDRVDAGMGLYNIDPDLCQNEALVVKIIGALRSAAMYCNDNDVIIRIIKSLIPKLEDKTLEIQWAFVSKSKEPSTNEKYYRFTPASDDGAVLRNAPIDNHGEKSLMLYKTISMIVRKKDPNKNDGGVTLLEIPLLTLSSPLTILCKIGEQNPDNPVYTAFRKACNSYKNDQLQFHAMNAVIKYINENEQDLGNGYKKLRALCKLWLFTNNGVKFIGDTSFNLAKSARNLGVKFIGSRIADEDLVDNNFTLKKLDFTGQWKSLRSEVDSRPEVVYSSVMMATNLYYNGVSIAPAGHPFVLRLDAPPALLQVSREGVTDEVLMDQFIKQKVSKEPIPEWVKLIPVTPPETSVMNYLKLMADGKANPYGNGFTPFRILSALYSSETDEAKALWGNESNFSTNEHTRKDVEVALKALIDVENNNSPEKGETHSLWLSRIVKMQKSLMTSNNGWQSMFNSVLIEMSRSSRLGEDSTREVLFDEGIAKTILGICEKAGITGILRSKKILPGSDVVAGYANKLEMNSLDLYQTPEGEDWRIFEKYDSPTFDLTPVLLGQNSDLDESLLVLWSNAITTLQTGNALIWQFKYKKLKGLPTDLSLYLAKEGNTELVPPAQTWRTKHADLLEKVGLTDDLEFGTDAQSEAEFLKKVVNHWVSQTDLDGRGLGYIGAVFDGKTAFCGNMDDSETSDKKLPEFYKHLKLREIKKVENETNMYNIIMVDDNLKNPTTYLVKVEILPDKKQYLIYSLEKVSKKIKTPIITLEIAEEMIQNISKYLGKITNPTEILLERAEKLSNFLDSIKNKNYSEYLVADEIVKIFGEKKFILSTIAKMLGKTATYFHDLNKLKLSEENTEENKEENNLCPIRHGYKNFM